MDRHVHLLALLEAEGMNDLGREGHGEGAAGLNEFSLHVCIKY
jgi:hypothetical protein